MVRRRQWLLVWRFDAVAEMSPAGLGELPEELFGRAVVPMIGLRASGVICPPKVCRIWLLAQVQSRLKWRKSAQDFLVRVILILRPTLRVGWGSSLARRRLAAPRAAAKRGARLAADVPRRRAAAALGGPHRHTSCKLNNEHKQGTRYAPHWCRTACRPRRCGPAAQRIPPGSREA